MELLHLKNLGNMDSPVRQYQKQKDYRRHKLFRKIRRRQVAERKQAIDEPIRQLKRKLKRYKGGKDEKKVYLDQSIDGINLWRDNQTGGYFYQEGNGPRIDLTPFNTLGSDDPTTWSFLDAEGKEYNPRRRYTGPTISQTTNAQRVANEVRDIQNTRTWRSDVADQLHNLGDALMWSTMAMNPEGEALMMKASEKIAPYAERIMNGIPHFRYRKLYPKNIQQTMAENNAAQLLQFDPLDVAKQPYSDALYEYLRYGGPDLSEKYIYGRKINGLPVDLFDVAKQPYADALNEQWSKDVVIGLSADAKQSLLDETIARNVRAFEEQGVDPLAIQEYRNRAAALMDDVRVGRYTNQDYIKAGKGDIGGFYNKKRNFLSVNTESGFPDGFVEKHEGRHLLDYKLDDDILMGTNPYRNILGSDFDSDATAKAMTMAVQKQNAVLTKAYDMDFINLSNTKYAGSLEGYPHMEREAITTNADSRRRLFDKKHANNWSLELKDKLIDKVPKEDIFDAVEQANGYGRRYIQFLRYNGKLTEEKANQFREAMKYKGILAIPLAVGAGYGLIGGSDDVTFNKGKDYSAPDFANLMYTKPPFKYRGGKDNKNKNSTMSTVKDIASFLPFVGTAFNSGKDSGIHIKPQNRGKFTALKKRTGKSASWFKAHGTPAQKKMATFALNARKWEHK